MDSWSKAIFMNECLPIRCPFCQSDDLEMRQDDDNYCVACLACGAQGPKDDVTNAAIGLWNSTDGVKVFVEYGREEPRRT